MFLMGSVSLDPSYYYYSLQSLPMISKWNPIRTRRSGDAYPDFQSAALTHQLQLVVVEFSNRNFSCELIIS
jgi:hypothetical protein